MRPIFRIGFMALIAYCGTIDTLRYRNSIHRAVVRERQLDPVEMNRPPFYAHPSVEPDQALAERRLAASGLAGEAHDLAVGNGEGDTVERLDVALEGAVVDAQVVDCEGHVLRSLGLKTSSRPTFIT